MTTAQTEKLERMWETSSPENKILMLRFLECCATGKGWAEIAALPLTVQPDELRAAVIEILDRHGI